MVKTNAQTVMNTFKGIPGMRTATLLIVLVVACLVLLEKNLSTTLSARGDIYPALLTFLVILAKILIPLAVLWTVFRLQPSSLGWVRCSLFTAVWKGLALAFMMMAFAFLYQSYSPLLFGTPYVSTGARILHEGTSLPTVGIGVSAALLNAFGEEIIFRGMLLPLLLPYRGITMALLLQSVVFTLYHFFPLQNSLLLFGMGIFFGWGYLWSGSLLTPVLAHLIENGLPSLIFLMR
jgi:membrane protease YdiL (CAAX protease family)